VFVNAVVTSQKIATTPGAALALAVSIPRILVCACGERRK
jgi:hypothetical protein